jgi:hypothetical protein
MNVSHADKAFISLDKMCQIIRNFLFSDEFIEKARKIPTAFTRKRKMPLINMISFMINFVKNSTQTALDNFYKLLDIKAINITQQAFSKARQKMKWECCRLLFCTTGDNFYQFKFITWHGFRVLAVDGSKIQVSNDPRLKHIFGTSGGSNSAITAQSSVLYDVLNDIIIDARIYPMSKGESQCQQLKAILANST